MKIYEVKVDNGGYPLTYRCKTIADAYGCVAALHDGGMRGAGLDLDDMMDVLVVMKKGTCRKYTINDVTIRVIEDSEA